MKKNCLLPIFVILFSGLSLAQPIPPDSLYLGQTPPGNTPVIFDLHRSAGTFAAERITVSGDGKEIYYSVVHNYYPTTGDTIKYYKYAGNGWTGPFNLFSGYLAPALSTNSDTLYYQSNTAGYKSYFSVRNGANWTNPQKLLVGLNSAHYLQATNSGTFYISSISDPTLGANDWCKILVNGTDSTAQTLGLPVNSGGDNLDFFVARDESFMIVAKDGLRISYHRTDGKWTNPKTLGAQINFGMGMWGPWVSADNKYLFYTTGIQPNYSDTYVYWVRADSLIDSLKYTNYAPYLLNKIPDQTAIKGVLYNYTIPDTTFFDDDGNNTLTYHAKLTNSLPLPSWLTFDTITGTFSGTPATTGTLNIRVTATDNAGASVWTVFTLTVTASASTGDPTGCLKSTRIGPNPTCGRIHVSLDECTDKPASAEVMNINGTVLSKHVFTGTIDLDLTGRAKGLYILRIRMGSGSFTRKIIFY